MRDSPPRLRRLATGPLVPRQVGAPMAADLDLWPFGAGEHPHHIMRRIRAIRRALTVVLWTLPLVPIQAVLLFLPGRGKVVLARIYWATLARLLGLTVRVIGQPAGGGDRPVVFVSNHSSWLDVPVLGGQLDACFVAKSEVSRWPLIGTIARLGRTAFVSRRRGATLDERDSMRGRLATGDNLILFPEGTTSDGSRVMPFRSTFFAIAEGEHPPLIQPVSVVYDRLAGLPTGRASRPLFAWYGDMDIASHYWRLAQHCGLRATVLLHAPLDPAQFSDRKALSRAVWGAVAEGAATLRQNRPAQPLSVAAQAASTIDEATPAYA
jgi:1-acyl-sn-glycerol-3-phosphate acyltransferase